MSFQNEKLFIIDRNEADKLKMATLTEAEVEALPPLFKKMFMPVGARQNFALPIDLELRLRASMKALTKQEISEWLRRYITPQPGGSIPGSTQSLSASLQSLGAEVLTIVLGRMLEEATPQVIQKIQKDIALALDLPRE